MTDGMTMRAIGAALALTTGLTTGAVSQEPAGAYRLMEVAGRALPAEVEKEWNCREEVTRGTLTLGADSLWTLRVTLREVCGDRAEVETETETGRYVMAGDTIRFRDDDEDDDDRDWSIGGDVDLDDLQTGTRGGNGTLAVRLKDRKTTLLFRR
jgi:hypothetical protein